MAHAELGVLGEWGGVLPGHPAEGGIKFSWNDAPGLNETLHVSCPRGMAPPFKSCRVGEDAREPRSIDSGECPISVVDRPCRGRGSRVNVHGVLCGTLKEGQSQSRRGVVPSSCFMCLRASC